MYRKYLEYCPKADLTNQEYLYWKQTNYPEPGNSQYQDPAYPCCPEYQEDPSNHPGRPCPPEQRHVHEVQGSVKIAEPRSEPHNHRFATVSGEAIPISPCDHVHDVKFRTDFYEDHFHEFWGRTLGAIPVGDRHVHFLESVTTRVDGHRHEFRVGTLIDDPIGD